MFAPCYVHDGKIIYAKGVDSSMYFLCIINVALICSAGHHCGRKIYGWQCMFTTFKITVLLLLVLLTETVLICQVNEWHNKNKLFCVLMWPADRKSACMLIDIKKIRLREKYSMKCVRFNNLGSTFCFCKSDFCMKCNRFRFLYTNQ